MTWAVIMHQCTFHHSWELKVDNASLQCNSQKYEQAVDKVALSVQNPI